MPIPGFQELMVPILKLTADQREHRARELTSHLAAQFNLSADELNEQIPSGRARVFANRVGWALSDLKAAGLLNSTGWGVYEISPSGLSLLATEPTFLTRKLLRQMKPGEPALIEVDGGSGEETTRTPLEVINAAYQALNNELVFQVLDQLKDCEWQHFETIVVDLLVAMGYGGSRKDAGEVLGKTGDQGVDGVIRQDPLGLDAVYIQAKRWAGTVGRPQVAEFVGSLEGFRARKGVMITTSRFTDDAIRFVARLDKTVVLIPGERLAELLIEHGVGVVAQDTFILKRVDLDYFNSP